MQLYESNIGVWEAGALPAFKVILKTFLFDKANC